MIAVYLPLLLSASAFLIAIVSFFFFKSYLKRRTGQERILAELREEVNNILKSINETVDRDISLIEEREKTLKILLDDIEKRIRVYIREMETRKDAADAYSALSSKKPPVIISAAALGTPVGTGESEPSAESGHSRVAGRGSPPEGAAGSSAVAPHAVAPLPIGEQIRSLQKAGLPTPAIASRLGISIAEVEFAAALLERREP